MKIEKKLQKILYVKAKLNKITAVWISQEAKSL